MLENMYDAAAPFFLRFKGQPLDQISVPHYLKQFLRDCGYGALKISYNTTRHGSAELQYDDYHKKETAKLAGADPDCAMLAFHSQSTQLDTYNKSSKTGCAHGFVKIRKLAADQRKDNEAVVESQLRFADLTKSNRNRAKDVHDAVEEDARLLDDIDYDEDEVYSAQLPPQSVDDGIDVESGCTFDAEQEQCTSKTHRGTIHRATGEATDDDSGSDLELEDYDEEEPIRVRERKRSEPSTAQNVSGNVKDEDEVEEGEDDDEEKPVSCVLIEEDIDEHDDAEEPLEEASGTAVEIGNDSENALRAEEQYEQDVSVIKELCLSFQQQQRTPETLIYERIDDRYPDIAEDDVYQHLMALNARWCCTCPNVSVNKQDWNDFYKRREAKPIQDFPWLQVRDVPGMRRGVFAKVAIEKNAVVSDYRQIRIIFFENWIMQSNVV
ncbi:hypothetical protein ANCCEY_13192 [Ancylostoma ceylanicum]|uniref:Uncharacterized protein n=1 Tax=Ancylostoma ceylanicum TaxID=53326 RepID=A0A0D6L7I4_9BILA|nr:hypothetical protein ANCCEY_13192 [Ancylostoma ceylanicum]